MRQRDDLEYRRIRSNADIEASRLVAALPTPQSTVELTAARERLEMLENRAADIATQASETRHRRAELVELLAVAVAEGDSKTAKSTREKLRALRDEADEADGAGPAIHNLITAARAEWSDVWKRSCDSLAPTYHDAIRKAEQAYLAAEEQYVRSQRILERLTSAASSLSWRSTNPPKAAGNGHGRGGGR